MGTLRDSDSGSRKKIKVWLRLRSRKNKRLTPTPGVRKIRCWLWLRLPESMGESFDSQLTLKSDLESDIRKKIWLPALVESKFTPGGCVLNWKLNSYTLNRTVTQILSMLFFKKYNSKKKIRELGVGVATPGVKNKKVSTPTPGVRKIRCWLRLRLPESKK